MFPGAPENHLGGLEGGDLPWGPFKGTVAKTNCCDSWEGTPDSSETQKHLYWKKMQPAPMSCWYTL